MSIRIALPDDRLLFCRPKCILSHVDSPFYESYASSKMSYKQLTTRIAVNAGGRCTSDGLWVLRDVHIVDHHLAEVMAWLRRTWRARGIDLVLTAPDPEPARRWARYIGDPRPKFLRMPVAIARRNATVRYAPQLDAVGISNWLHQEELEGDVLVFAASATQRDLLVRGLRITCLHPVYVIHDRVPFAARKCPRVLVGGPGLDHLLSSDTVERVQHVVDYGAVYRVRQDTGNDWEIATITRNMAMRRRSVAGSKASGVCLCAYESDGVLQDEPFATHTLRHDLCHAKLAVKFGEEALAGFPIPLECTMDMPRPVAELMARLNVERPVAEIIHASPSIEAGVAIAAIVARHAGPFPGSQYATFQKTPSAFVEAATSMHKWAAVLRISRNQVLKELRRVSWATALPIVRRAYRRATAYHTGSRDRFVDAATGDVLRCKFAHQGISTIIYTHRHKNEILAYVVDSPNGGAANLQTRSVPRPMAMDNPIEIAAMEAHFEAHRVVATKAPYQILLTSAPGVPIDEVIGDWLATMKIKALGKPLAVPIGDDMNILFTAGLRFADAVQGKDFAIARCDVKRMNKDELVRLHGMPIRFLEPTTPVFLLPKRQAALDTLSHLSNVTLQGAATHLSRLQPAHVSVELVIRTYLGKSTGRVSIKGTCHPWMKRLLPEWGWNVMIATETAIKLHNVPQHMDEFDIAKLLRIDVARITVERGTNVITQLACVRELLQKLPEAADTHRTLRVNDAVVRMDEADVETALQLLYTDLPLRNDIVDQPIRAFWVVSTLPGSLPPKNASSSKTHILIHRDALEKETALLRFAISSAKDEAKAMTPEVVWWPQLADPRIHCDVPNATQQGAKFMVYGSPLSKDAALRKLAKLAARAPPAVSSKKHEPCNICFDREAFHRMQICGCRICFVCLATTLETKCFDATFLGELLCPFCNERLATDDIVAAVSDPALFAHATKVARFFSSRLPQVIMECPARCGFFGRIQGGDPSLDCRRCGVRYCTRCSERFGALKLAHRGYCDKLWDTSFWNDFATEATSAGAKPCPTCGAFVVKDGGCSHMTCSAPLCQTHFCWKCGQAFSHHQNSPLAQGTVVEVGDASVTVAIQPDTWATPCMTPCPVSVNVKREFFPEMLLENETLEKGAKAWVFSYIYDHIDACVVP